jgi:hypothetical protein
MPIPSIRDRRAIRLKKRLERFLGVSIKRASRKLTVTAGMTFPGDRPGD